MLKKGILKLYIIRIQPFPLLGRFVVCVMTDENRPLEDFGDKIAKQLAAAAETADKIRLQAKEADRIETFWERLKKHVASGWLLHILEDLESEVAVVNTASQHDPEFQRDVDSLRESGKWYLKRLSQRFPALIEQAAKEAQLPLDRTSRHPRYDFDQGFFRLEIDDHKGKVRLTSREGSLAVLPADVGAAIELLLRERKRVVDRSFDGKKFVKRLKTNY